VPEFLHPRPVNPEAEAAGTDLWHRLRASYGEHAIGEDAHLDAAYEAEYAALLRRFSPVQATVADVADHIDHVVAVAGIDHVGIGSDFDGGGRLEDCRDVSELPALTAELLRRIETRRQYARQYVLLLKPSDDTKAAGGLVESRNPNGCGKMEAVEFRAADPWAVLPVIAATEQRIGESGRRQTLMFNGSAPTGDSSTWDLYSQGVKLGDRLISVNDVQVSTSAEVEKILGGFFPGPTST